MADVGIPFAIVSVLFGVLMGFGLGRNPEDRTAATAATVLCTGVGAVSWALATAGTRPEVAGVSMTLGGVAAALVLVLGGRRASAPPSG